MTMKKKLIALTSVVLILGMATLGILAYLTATAEAENTLASGDVAIKLVEQEREDGTVDSVENNIKDFQNNVKALVPATVDFAATTTDYWSTANNAVDKIVSVDNIGDNAAYIRVWYAFEEGDNWSLININKNEDGITWVDNGTKVIEGINYHIMSATYVDAVSANTSSAVGLKQVALSSEATNEDVEAFGDDGYQILVFAQAIQAQGFPDAVTAIKTEFGEEMPWEESVVVSTIDEFKAAVTNGGEFYLGEDFAVDDGTAVKAAATINGNGNTITRETGNGNPFMVSTTEKVVFDDVVFETVKGNAVLATRTDGANITVKNSTFNNLAAPSTGNTAIQAYANNVTMTFENCDFNNMPIVTTLSYPDGIKFVFNNCDFTWEGPNCPGMIQIANYLNVDLDFNDCTYTYNVPSTSTSVKEFINTSWDVTGTIDFDNFKVNGTATNTWPVVDNLGTKVDINAKNNCEYTFNGSNIDFNKYLSVK